jgi:ATPase subunit of ABC transporter with duplicated ATPase domains
LAHPGQDTRLFDGFDLKLVGPERVALQGRNGAGKTTLLRLVMGELTPDAGHITVGVERWVYLDQRAAVLDGEASILDNFRGHNPELSESESRLRLAQFLFVKDSVFKPVRVLSGGERLRAALACTLMAARPPQLVLLDEPTNHLDLEAIASMEETLSDYQGALLIVSHDEDFLRNVHVHRRVELTPVPISRVNRR